MRRLFAEWEKQDGVILALPHKDSDWASYFEEALSTYRDIAKEIAKREKLVLICENANDAKKFLDLESSHIIYLESKTNDTWCRDYAPIFIEEDGRLLALNYNFNGWGLKFASNFDNLINYELQKSGLFGVEFEQKGIVLEGGSIDCNGNGEILTNTLCLLEKNRNPHMSRNALDSMLKSDFGAKKIHWLNHGYLRGDDTDSHIDTLARFIDTTTIIYQKCYDKNDEHYEELNKLEDELKELKNIDGEPFKLIPLPLPSPIYYDNERLPASYVNFLFVNGAILLPIYGDSCDKEVVEILRNHVKNREIVPIDCSVLVRQHGSLHCISMQIPHGALKS